MNKLYFGDNLDVLREFVADESVDLIYLDPPFNSQAQYNVLFVTPEEQRASAQAGAFRDTWSWGDEAEWAYAQTMRAGGPAAKLLDALRSALGETDMMAYLAMMTIRLMELRRVLKPTGSLYLHCDPTASHYLKLILDGLFGVQQFTNEIIWVRSTPKGHAFTRYPSSHDVLLYFRRDRTVSAIWNAQYLSHRDEYIDKYYNLVDDETGRKFQATSLINPNADRPNLTYEFHGHTKVWRWTKERMLKAEQDGRVYFPPKGGIPREKRFLDEQEGVPVTSVWSDISPVNARAAERLGYPTQKPVALLERIIRASSNEGDVVLDPFCGCGTTIAAAEGLRRNWIGIDVAIHAVEVIKARLSRLPQVADYQLEGIPKDFASAVRLAERDKYQFQWWANYLFNPHALREQKKGADRGVDGELFFPNGPGRTWGKMLTSVKGGENVGPAMVRDFAHVLARDGADLGLFICLRRPTKAMMREATSAGYADTAHGVIPKLQIVAIEDWFEDRNGPTLPPLNHLPSVAFSPARRPRRTVRPSFFEPELPLSFTGGKGAEVVRTLNPGMVREVA